MGWKEKQQIACLENTVSDLIKKLNESKQETRAYKQLADDYLEDYLKEKNSNCVDYSKCDDSSIKPIVNTLYGVIESLATMEWNNITYDKINNVIVDVEFAIENIKSLCNKEE